ncbi:MAG: hypothetical protein Q4C88_05370 [Akkermansia sp.]|nr:hypothetical protein [Akkermansia sp.]
MAKLTIKSAPAAPAPVKEAPKQAGWTYYVIPPLLIIGVFWYCSKQAHKISTPAPAQPAVAAAPAAPAQDEAAETSEQPNAEQPAATSAADEDFAGGGGDAADDESQQEETEE